MKQLEYNATEYYCYDIREGSDHTIGQFVKDLEIQYNGKLLLKLPGWVGWVINRE